MKKILGACIGSCVHVAGILNFLNIAKRSGYNTRFSGSALDIDVLLQEIDDYKPDIVDRETFMRFSTTRSRRRVIFSLLP